MGFVCVLGGGGARDFRVVCMQTVKVISSVVMS